MLYTLLFSLSEDIALFDVLRSQTLRTGAALITAMLISFLIGPKTIRWLSSVQKNGQPIRHNGPSSHLSAKQKTPTMGGVIILTSLITSTLLWADLSNHFIWSILFLTFGFSLVGLWDDYLKVMHQSPDGLKWWVKLILEIIIAFFAVLFIQKAMSPDMASGLTLPGVKNLLIDLGILFVPFAILVIVGTGNAVNLTDGLDGLAIVPIIFAVGSFTLISYIVGHSVFADYLKIHSINGTGELTILCGAIIGSAIGFLWYNAPPAMVFMGDMGSLSLGAALGGIAVAVKHEVTLAIIGGLFVIETLSVIVQIISFKLTGKRVFLMAPLHHHFEKKGWPEPTIVIRFWIISAILALIGLASLQLG